MLKQFLQNNNINALYNQRKYKKNERYEQEYNLDKQEVKKEAVIICPDLNTVFSANLVNDQEFLNNLLQVIKNHKKYVRKS